MIHLIDMDKVTSTMQPVATPDDVVGKGVKLHPEGLYSESIFGAQNSPERKTSYSYINLHCKVLHPAMVKPVWLLNRKIIETLQYENERRSRVSPPPPLLPWCISARTLLAAWSGN
jgi:hypothetical protein